MTDRFKLLVSGIDVSALSRQLEENPQLWGANNFRKTVGENKPHQDMTDIWVRYNDFSRFNPDNPEAFNDEHIPIWYPAWNVLTALQPLVFGLMADVYGEVLGGILITKIPPGKGIGAHVDRGWHVDYYDKFYLSIKSSPSAVFVFEDETGREELSPKVGDLYLIDNRKRHFVENNSNEDRITCIICIRTQMFGRT